MAETIDLRDGGKLSYDPVFLPREEADRLLKELLSANGPKWDQEKGVFPHPQPRLTAYYGDEGVTYRYSRAIHQPVPWTAALLAVKGLVEEASGATFNSLLLNRYRDGQDSVD